MKILLMKATEEQKQKMKEYYLSNRDKILKQRRVYSVIHSKARTQKANEWQKNNLDKQKCHSHKSARKYVSENREKIRAHSKVNYAISRNRLKKPSNCVYNNANCKGVFHYHHMDYQKPMDVVSMCRAHHKAWHKVLLTEGI